MNEIKVEFHRFDNFVFGRVISMPEELRGTVEIIGDGKYNIYSVDVPQVINKTLYLLGSNKSRDKCYFSYNYNTIVEAQSAISAFETLIRKWNAEHREILDDAEKEYLSAVIKPFKHRIKNIIKIGHTQDVFEYISLKIKSIQDIDEEAVLFPYFRVGTMYKGMKANKEYTLKELGLE